MLSRENYQKLGISYSRWSRSCQTKYFVTRLLLSLNRVVRMRSRYSMILYNSGGQSNQCSMMSCASNFKTLCRPRYRKNLSELLPLVERSVETSTIVPEVRSPDTAAGSTRVPGGCCG